MKEEEEDDDEEEEEEEENKHLIHKDQSCELRIAKEDQFEGRRMANKGRFLNLDFLCLLLAFFSAVSLPITYMYKVR